ncbi:adenylate/guanylate cyclase domain-containing protein [Rhizobium sp. YS-1r]|uniref:Adenylate/guanylate cyclase domain-containing protein n=1 Tax=Neorhizobium phenanthreniclasticum TaxID=3157917 RepID=A0ABV0LXD0_9HYPH|nr:adenylate/guanylate cyclase domain-containing protein [Rhizobium sp. YS-1r]KGD99943.1 adenylate cyclase [Rhizobium sp. YS-1r]
MERRLAAILIADVVGYSHLSEIDEERTRAQFHFDAESIFFPAIETNNGRLVKTIGDGLLVEFHSVVDALRCALDVQVLKAERNASVPPDQQMQFRIGINLGDIIVEGEDIHGDGVNIADRIQALAEPGGIAVSGSTYDQLKSKLPVGYLSLGRQKIKGIAEPIRVYRVLLQPAAAGKTIASRGRWWPWVHVVTILICGLLLASMVYWWQPWSPSQSQGAIGRFAYPLPDKPSVAVLPFINVSGDATHDHLAEGLTDDLITELSKVSGLFVIARHSVFAVRNTSGTIQDVAAELGVQYVLEGTLQRDGLRLRINVKLIEAMTGLSLWAEKYDRKYADLFAVQDDVIGKIISALAVKLSQGERTQLARIPTDNLEAYDYYMRAEHEGFIYGDVATYRRTLSFYQKAIDLDPGFANAHAGIARVAVDVWRNDYNFLWSAAIARKIAYDAAGQALKLDPNNARAHAVLALLQWVDGRETEALESAKTAIAAQPNDAEAYGNLALILAHTGSRGQAITEIERALRLDPSPAPGFQLLAGIVFYTAREYRRAIPLIEAALGDLPRAEPAREYLAAAYASEEDQARAEQEAGKLLELFPESNLTYYSYLYDYWRDEDLDRHLAALKSAGVPQWPFAFQGKDADRVKGTDLRDLIDSRTWVGRHKNGTDFMQYFDKTGKTAYRSTNTNITGVVEIQDDSLCEKFDGYFLDRLVCGQVFRNTDSTGRNDTYVHVTPRSLQFFSLVRDGH